MADQAISFVDPAGGVHLFTDQDDIEVEFGQSGRFMPTFNRREETVPQDHGARLLSIVTNPREVAIPVEYLGTSPTGLRALLRSWAYWLNPLRGDGVLRVTAPDSAVRELRCRYAGGLELAEGIETMGHWQRAVLVFRAVDPFWYDQTDTITQYSTGTAATFFPFFPMQLSSSTIFGDVTVNNTGDVDAWPVWLVTGPGSGLVLRNDTTGMLIDLPITLAGGESVTIDTTPGAKSVTKNDGTNMFASMTALSSLWPLIIGNNAVRIELSGATAASRVQLAYRRRFLTP